METKEWIVDWFVKNSNVSTELIRKNFEENYLENGWIDSLKFVSFITELEDKFKIKFSNEEFQNTKFSTVEGLSQIIEEKLNEKL